jgi:hypothetical protein
MLLLAQANDLTVEGAAALNGLVARLLRRYLVVIHAVSHGRLRVSA